MGEVIKVTPKDLLASANEIKNSSKKYEKIAKVFMENATKMGSAWEGEDNQKFVTQIKGFSDDLDAMVKKLNTVAETLTLQANNYSTTQKNNIDNVSRLQN